MEKNINSSLEAIRADFLEKLPDKISALQDLFQQVSADKQDSENYQLLIRLTHNLAGSAGTFGLPGISEAARKLELALNATFSSNVVVDELDEPLRKAMIRLDEVVQFELNSDAPSLIPPLVTLPAPQISPLIYMVEDNAEQARHIHGILEQGGYRIRHFFGTDDFVSAFDKDEKPAAVLMDMAFPEGKLAGAGSIEAVRRRCDICPPVVFLSVRDDIEARITAYRAGASHYVVKPVNGRKLISCLDKLTLRTPLHPYRILLVDDDPSVMRTHAEILRQAGMDVLTLEDPLKALDVLREFKPEVLVLDVYMPVISGPELAALIRDDEAYISLPILFLSAEADLSKQLMALSLGGDHFLVKPLEPSYLVTAVSTRAKRYRDITAIESSLKQTLYEREREHLALNYHGLVSVTDAGGNITYANKRFCDVSGFQLEEMLGKNHRIIKSGKHSEDFYRDIWQTILAGEVWQGEICNQSKEGKIYWVESTIVPFLDEQGKPYQFVSIRTNITSLKTLEMEAKLSSERLRRSQIFANIGTWDWNIESGELFWSERVAPLFGYPAGDLETSYQNFMSAVHPDDQSKVTSAVMSCIDDGTDYDIEHRVVWPDGQVRWVQERGDVVRDSDGKPLRMLGVIMEIHDKKMAEQARQESEEKFRNLYELSPVGIVLNTMDGGFQEANVAFLEIVGYTAAECASQTYWDLTPREYEELEREQLKSLDATGRYGPYEKEYIHKKGQRVPVLLSGTIVRDRDGVKRIWSIVQDISQRKQAEEDLKIFRRVFDSTEQGISVTDVTGRIIYSNRAHDRIHDLSHNKVINRNFMEFFSEQSSSWAKKEIMTTIRQGNSWSGLLSIVQPDGNEVVVASNVGFISDSDGVLQYIFSIMKDYSEEQRRQQQLATAKESAERANQAKSEFLSSMSHELRTPMNAILGFAQIMQFDKALGERHVDSVHEILKAGRHLLNLINEVLDLAKVESGRIELSLEPVEVGQVVRECLSLLATLADTNGIRMNSSISEGFFVRADRTRFKQVVLNLLSNAIKYNRKGGEVKMELQSTKDERLRILVTDTGEGIPEERLPELFLPFCRLDKEGSEIEGTGIGLTITQRIIQLMGGSVDVKSEVGVGSTFWIELPMESSPGSLVAGSWSEGEEAASGSPHDDTSHIVIYVEDNPANLKLVSQLLGRRKNIHLLTAHTPGLGIELVRSRNPELILLDINMPEMNGYQLLDLFKSDASLKGIPIVAITANAMTRDIERGRKAGFDEYLTKPLDVDEFYRVIDRYLGLSGGTSSG